MAIPEVVNRGGEVGGQRKGITGGIFFGSTGERLAINEFLAEPDVVLAGDLVLTTSESRMRAKFGWSKVQPIATSRSARSS